MRAEGDVDLVAVRQLLDQLVISVAPLGEITRLREAEAEGSHAGVINQSWMLLMALAQLTSVPLDAADAGGLRFDEAASRVPGAPPAELVQVAYAIRSGAVEGASEEDFAYADRVLDRFETWRRRAMESPRPPAE